MVNIEGLVSRHGINNNRVLVTSSFILQTMSSLIVSSKRSAQERSVR